MRLLSRAQGDDAGARGALPRRPCKRAPEGPQSTLEVKVTSIGNLNERVETKNSKQSFIISQPRHVGGLADAPTPLEYLLSGAVGCYAAVFAFYAAKLGVDYESFEATARTSFDVRGHMMPERQSSGFQKVSIAITVKSAAAPDGLREVERLPPSPAAPASPRCASRCRSKPRCPSIDLEQFAQRSARRADLAIPAVAGLD